jgi:hypothetical protein
VRLYASSAFSMLPAFRQQAAMPNRTSAGQLGQVRRTSLYLQTLSKTTRCVCS